MSSSSKLAYLSKYTGGDQQQEESKKKKKKKKDKKRKRDQDVVREVDLDVEMPELPNKSDDEEEDEEGPAVVVAMEDREFLQEENVGADSHRRRRHDSDSDEEYHKRRRHDSDNDSDSGSQAVRRHRKRYDSDDNKDSADEARRRRRHDSSSSDSEGGAPPRRRKRYDSDDDSNDSRRNKRRSRHDSDDEDESKNGDKPRMSSGHSAGLQQAEDFRRAESKLQRKRHEEAQAMVDKHGMGDTVYRDAEGRQVEGEVMHKKAREELDEETQKRLNKGRVQREKEESHRRDMEKLQESSFARYKDDTGLEDLRRDVIREGDPMAAQAAKKKAKVLAASGRPQRPVYKGPAPKPNRFGIRPGYRWDGVDRGNGFEDKVLALKFSAGRKKEEAYRWSAADM